ncbi:DUF7822 domain-containing protein [Corynebacterium freiburgense]|uniref:DUF7822 domain-containing protein n=1 Tax=Corynebacterium freiburgense TaxID=556548 RepID=UPI00146FA1B0|nr:hypothetical protein [Corynebacterium freiburgense]
MEKLDQGQHHYRIIASCPYQIPLLFQLLCSSKTKQITSKLFQGANQKNIAIRGDFQSGLTAVLDFLEQCVQRNQQVQVMPMAELKTLVKQVQEAIQRGDITNSEYFVLESAEVHSMLCTDLEQATRRLCLEVIHAPKKAVIRMDQIFSTESQAHAQPDTSTYKDENPRSPSEQDFVIPDFDAMTDQEYFAFLAADYAQFQRDYSKAEQLKDFGFSNFGVASPVCDFTVA